MKKLFFIGAMALLLSSCVVKYPYRQYAYSVDFTQFTNQGFFLTESNSVSFDYDPIGSVSAVVESGYEVLNKTSIEELNSNDDIYTFEQLGKMKFGKYIYASPEAAIANLVETSKKLGANGVINLDVGYISAITDKNGSIISPSSYVVSGMAIKSL